MLGLHDLYQAFKKRNFWEGVLHLDGSALTFIPPAKLLAVGAKAVGKLATKALSKAAVAGSKAIARKGLSVGLKAAMKTRSLLRSGRSFIVNKALSVRCKAFSFIGRSGKCFVAGTLVLTLHGALPIEQVQAGMEVLAYDTTKEAWTTSTVGATHEQEAHASIVTLSIQLSDGSTQVIEATGGHPFYVASGDELESRPLSLDHAGQDGHLVSDSGGRWVDARHVRLGDQLLAYEFKSATVIGLQFRNERTKVYNLTVLRHRNYAVGQAGVVVHNVPCPQGQLLVPDANSLPKKGVYKFTDADGIDYVGQSGNIARRLRQHIKSGKLDEKGIGEIKTYAVTGSKQKREIVEQLEIIKSGGIANLSNLRNPIGPRRAILLPKYAREFLEYTL